jgi:hypothetical protein
MLNASHEKEPSMIRARRVALCLAVATCLAAVSGGVAFADPPQQTFSSAKAKSSVPVTPKQRISSQNRKAGMTFDNKGNLQTRKLPNAKLSKTRSPASSQTAQ